MFWGNMCYVKIRKIERVMLRRGSNHAAVCN